ncbi:hypothetical protein V8D89_008517 [Ganoderma adspersum]
MRFSSFLSPLALVLSASATLASARSPGVPPPEFKEVFAGQFNLASRHRALGPFGARVHNAMSGGSLWDPVTGEVLADILPFSDDGVGGGTGPFFPMAVMPLIWKGDGHFASFSTVGIRGGSDHRSWEYAHAETDSPTYSWMNGRFFIVRVNSTASPRLTFNMYELMD